MTDVLLAIFDTLPDGPSGRVKLYHLAYIASSQQLLREVAQRSVNPSLVKRASAASDPSKPDPIRTGDPRNDKGKEAYGETLVTCRLLSRTTL